MSFFLMIPKFLKSILEDLSMMFNMGKFLTLIFISVPSNERINIAHLEIVLRLPMEYIPDPRTVIEDA